MRKVLLISSSKYADTPYLEHALPWLKQHFSGKTVTFIPYAGVAISYDEYLGKVQQALAPAGIKVKSIHHSADPLAAIESAEAVAVGGGNTFRLLQQLYDTGVMNALRRRISQGMPYAGWSAGSNIAGLSIRTTNDMPIVQPPSFTALAAVPFQINPHYTNATPAGHRGETRDERIMEFMQLNPATSILGIPEGTALSVTGAEMQLLGNIDGVVFRDGTKLPLKAGKPCSEWL